jgi:hypothetical protein
MDTDITITKYDLYSIICVSLLVGAALGFVLNALSIGGTAVPDAISLVVKSALAPLIIAIFGAGLRIRYERNKERRQEQHQWKLRTVSLLQRIALELNQLDPDISLDRPKRTAVHQYDESGPLSHVDSLFTELMEHYTMAPPGVDERWKIEIARLKHGYDNPGNHPDIDQDPATSMSVDYLKSWYQPQLEHVLHKLGATTEGISEDQLPRYTAADVASVTD